MTEITADRTRTTRRKGERIFLAMITIILGLLFLSLFFVLQRGFKDVNKRLKEGTMVNLNDSNPGKRFRTLLQKGYYFEDKRDISVIEKVIADRLHAEGNDIQNIGELNKQRYNVVADDVFISGGTSFKKRVNTSRSMLGYTGDD